MSKNKTDFKIGIWFFSVFGVLVFVSLTANLLISNATNISLDKTIAEAKELSRPANLKIITLKPSDCEDCFDIDPILDNIKKSNVKIEEEKSFEYNDEKGKELIKKYNIKKLPSFIVEGEIEKEEDLKKMWSKMGEVKNGVFIFRKTPPPYQITDTGEVKGRIKLTMLIDKNCDACYDVTGHKKILSKLGMPVSNNETIEINNSEGKALLRKYNIKMVPTIIISGDMNEYPNFKKIWTQVGTIENDGAYVMKKGVKRMGTYMDLTTGEIINPRKKVNIDASKVQKNN